MVDTNVLIVAGVAALLVLYIVLKILKFAVTKIILPVGIIYALFVAWQSGWLPF